ncbi:enoyl-CoA hydratase [Marinicauda pacifica]|uniref:Enoyl-CoA hydratase n=1 Tax=Marinicauda pacifica TaxID=1133559 RepID=A0A4S2HG54_9PROT|nr:enoyl-CoA hydratase [Marinicauda pacifica]TGY94883.1 enoyl-CoA hydratase [Marinicauda pacifica]GGE39622.1 enoyl-CoA hydratase [Marinicauda pacifica]
MSDDIRVEDTGPVRVIRFDRVAKKNAITRAMYSAMARALEEASGDTAIRVVVIAGQDGVFTAGNDLVDFMEAPPHIGGADTPPVEDFMRALMGCSKPVIAAVDGMAIGIGTTLLLHCDLAYASTRAVFKTPFVDLALAPEFGSSQILPGLLGRSVASELLLLGESWDAGTAKARHLVSDVFEAETLEDEVMTRARALAAKAPSAIRAAKSLMTSPSEDLMERIKREGELFAELLRSEEFEEAVGAFMERRKPDFSKFG